MVNSGSFDAAGSEGESVKGEFTQLEDDAVTASNPCHLVGACATEANFTAVVPDTTSDEPTTTSTTTTQLNLNATKTSLQCSVPLDKVKNVLERCHRTDPDKTKLSNLFIFENYLKQNKSTPNTADAEKPAVKRLLCLFCDRTFTSNNLKQKHVDRCHAANQSRRSSSRTSNHSQFATACNFCSKLNHTDHTLKELLEHLIDEHSNKYFACLLCQERFTSTHALREHNKNIHNLPEDEAKLPPNLSSPVAVTSEQNNTAQEMQKVEIKVSRPTEIPNKSDSSETVVSNSSPSSGHAKPLKRNSSLKNISSPEPNETNQENEEKLSELQDDVEDIIHANVISSEDIKKNQQQVQPEIEDLNLTNHKVKTSVDNLKTRSAKRNASVNKKISVKSTKNGVRTNNLRTTRATVKQLKQINSNFSKTRKSKVVKSELDQPEKEVKVKKLVVNTTSVFSLVNAYTYKYEKIYDHASDSIKDANSVQFNAVFDREFYSQTVTNIRENLLHHLDGKLNMNIESESRISNFEHNPTGNTETDTKSLNETIDNFGCDLSLNAVTPVATLPSSSQYEDFDSQIEYGAKASQKKPKKVTVVKYKFPNKKYNSLFYNHASPIDLTCLDMWTQLTVKNRQRTCQNDDNFENETLYIVRPSGIAPKHQVEELNKILDKRGPFEDLRMEANAVQFLELRRKAKDLDNLSEETSNEVYYILDELLNRVATECNKKHAVEVKKEEIQPKVEETHYNLDLPNYFQLERGGPAKPNQFKVDKTDKIAMICSSQDENNMTENKLLELTGEWTRPRIYICATCGLKVPNLKSLEDHKNAIHPQIWNSHYEFVGNQSQIYRHLSIPGLGKVGLVETLPQNRAWQRSDARMCTKCTKQCHNLGELHKHMLECGGDWTWMLARKKCKYRPYGARSRRRRQRGYKRSCNPDVQRVPREHKPKIKPILIGPRPKPSKPSDAETIERMLANLPPKRHRKVISMRDGIQRPRKSQSSNSQSSSMLPQRKSHFKSNAPQITKQSLQNALKRKITARNLRQRTNKESQNENILSKLRSRVPKKTRDGDSSTSNNKKEDESVTNGIKNKFNKNKRIISRILGSKIFDSNTALVSRRRLVQMMTQNNLIRKTRLRSRIAANNQASNSEKRVQQSTNETSKSKNNEENKKMRSSPRNVNNAEENNDKAEKTEEIVKESKKFNTKRILSALITKSNKKSKLVVEEEIRTNISGDQNQKAKIDLISATIEDVVKQSVAEDFATKNEENIQINEEISQNNKNKKPLRRTRSSNSLKKLDTSKEEIKSNEDSKVKSTEPISTTTNEIKPEEKQGKINKIGKKTNKLVQNVKSLKQSFKKQTEEKDNTIAKKLMRTLSFRSSKKRKAEKISELKSDECEKIVINVTENIIEDDGLKKNVRSESSKQSPSESKSENDTNTIDSNEIEFVEAKSSEDLEAMPVLEKIEPINSETIPELNVPENIPILIPVSSNLLTENDDEINLVQNNTLETTTNIDGNINEDRIENLKSEDKSQINNTLNKFKNKIKRSGRGLNDCIAMLKCKLEQKYQNEPSLVDKSNLFILNSCTVNKHRQSSIKTVETSNSIQNTNITNKTSITLTIDGNKNSKVESKELPENLSSKVSEKLEEKVSSIINEKLIKESIVVEKLQVVQKSVPCQDKPEFKNTNVLEIPAYKNNKNENIQSEVSTVETQTVDELLPNNSLDFIPANIGANIQLSYVLDATLKNCLMECVINKVEKFKFEHQNVILNTISSQALENRKKETVRKRRTNKKISTPEDKKVIPNIPTLLNTAFIEKSPARSTATRKTIVKNQESSDDDIPLSKFANSADSCSNLNINLPIPPKKKRNAKKKIAFTPLILNKQLSTMPQISLQEKIEQRISLDNSMNSKIEQIQAEILALKQKNQSENVNIIQEINSKPNEEALNLDLKQFKSQIIEKVNELVNENNETFQESAREDRIVDEIAKAVDLSNNKKEIMEELLKEKDSTEDVTSSKNVEITDKIMKEKDLSIETNELISGDVIKDGEISSITIENSDVKISENEFSKTEEENNLEKSNNMTDVRNIEILNSFDSLSQQIMAIEDEPNDNLLINKTLTEANIEASITIKNNCQNMSVPNNTEFMNKTNIVNIDSGKENTDEKIYKRRGRKPKKGKGKTKISLNIPSTETEISSLTNPELEPEIVIELPKIAEDSITETLLVSDIKSTLGNEPEFTENSEKTDDLQIAENISLDVNNPDSVINNDLKVSQLIGETINIGEKSIIEEYITVTPKKRRGRKKANMKPNASDIQNLASINRLETVNNVHECTEELCPEASINVPLETDKSDSNSLNTTLVSESESISVSKNQKGKSKSNHISSVENENFVTSNTEIQEIDIKLKENINIRQEESIVKKHLLDSIFASEFESTIVPKKKRGSRKITVENIKNSLFVSDTNMEAKHNFEETSNIQVGSTINESVINDPNMTFANNSEFAVIAKRGRGRRKTSIKIIPPEKENTELHAAEDIIIDKTSLEVNTTLVSDNINLETKENVEETLKVTEVLVQEPLVINAEIILENEIEPIILTKKKRGRKKTSVGVVSVETENATFINNINLETKEILKEKSENIAETIIQELENLKETPIVLEETVSQARLSNNIDENLKNEPETPKKSRTRRKDTKNTIISTDVDTKIKENENIEKKFKMSGEAVVESLTSTSENIFEYEPKKGRGRRKASIKILSLEPENLDSTSSITLKQNNNETTTVINDSENVFLFEQKKRRGRKKSSTKILSLEPENLNFVNNANLEPKENIDETFKTIENSENISEIESKNERNVDSVNNTNLELEENTDKTPKFTEEESEIIPEVELKKRRGRRKASLKILSLESENLDSVNSANLESEEYIEETFKFAEESENTFEAEPKKGRGSRKAIKISLESENTDSVINANAEMEENTNETFKYSEKIGLFETEPKKARGKRKTTCTKICVESEKNNLVNTANVEPEVNSDETPKFVEDSENIYEDESKKGQSKRKTSLPVEPNYIDSLSNTNLESEENIYLIPKFTEQVENISEAEPKKERDKRKVFLKISLDSDETDFVNNISSESEENMNKTYQFTKQEEYTSETQSKRGRSKRKSSLKISSLESDDIDSINNTNLESDEITVTASTYTEDSENISEAESKKGRSRRKASLKISLASEDIVSLTNSNLETEENADNLEYISETKSKKERSKRKVNLKTSFESEDTNLDSKKYTDETAKFIEELENISEAQPKKGRNKRKSDLNISLESEDAESIQNTNVESEENTDEELENISKTETKKERGKRKTFIKVLPLNLESSIVQENNDETSIITEESKDISEPEPKKGRGRRKSSLKIISLKLENSESLNNISTNLEIKENINKISKIKDEAIVEESLMNFSNLSAENESEPLIISKKGRRRVSIKIIPPEDKENKILETREEEPTKDSNIEKSVIDNFKKIESDFQSPIISQGDNTKRKICPKIKIISKGADNFISTSMELESLEDNFEGTSKITDEAIAEDPFISSSKLSSENKFELVITPKKGRGKKKNFPKIKIITSTLENPTSIAANQIDLEMKENINELLEITKESVIHESLINNFNSIIENESESMIMENKQIIQPEKTNLNINNKIEDVLLLDQNAVCSDSEDEVPLAFFIKNKTSDDTVGIETNQMIDSVINNDDTNVIPDIDDTQISDKLINDLDDINIVPLNLPQDKDSLDINENASLVFNDEEISKLVNITAEDILENIEESQLKNYESNNVAENDEKENNFITNICQTSKEDMNNIIEDPKTLEFVASEKVNDNLEPEKENCIENASSSTNDKETRLEDIREFFEENNVQSLKTSIIKNENIKSEFITTPDMADKSLVIRIKKKINIKLRKPKKTRRRVIPRSLVRNYFRRKDDDVQLVYICEICNKTFKRKENLTSHKRTLTHIAKLSEIEARENLSKKSNKNEENQLNILNENLSPEDNDSDFGNENMSIEFETKDMDEIDGNDDNFNFTKEEHLLLEEVDIKEQLQIRNQESTDDIEECSTDLPQNLDHENFVQNIPDYTTVDLLQNLENEHSVGNTVVENMSPPAEEILRFKPEKSVTNLLPGIIVNSSNANLKLVDIINEVLDKPVNDLNIQEADYLPRNIIGSPQDDNDKYSEPKRYKSLGERKSFDSDNFSLPPKSSEDISSVENYSLRQINNGLLSKQLSLLENIIEETDPTLNYIDDSVSLESSQFDEPVLEQNLSENEISSEVNKLNNIDIKFPHNSEYISNLMKQNNHFSDFGNISESFAKPDEISIEYHHENEQHEEKTKKKRHKEENSTRKILNRDEELFLECCSLLKSGSEISGVPKKSTKQIQFNNFNRSNDTTCLPHNVPISDHYIQRDTCSWLAQSSRENTPIGEPFVNNDWSNSNSAISSEWLAQKAPSSDGTGEDKIVLKKVCKTTVNTKYSDMHFEDISIENSTDTSKTLMAIDHHTHTENIPIDFHHVDFSNNNLNQHNGQEQNDDAIQFKSNALQLNQVNEDSEISFKEDDGPTENKKFTLRVRDEAFLKQECDMDLKKKVVSAFGGLMAKALSNRLHAVVRRSKKSKSKRDFASAIQSSIIDYTIPAKKIKTLNQVDSDSSDCPKKMITKGAMKIFEGLKVSIPTQDLNLKEVLNSTKIKENDSIETENEDCKNIDEVNVKLQEKIESNEIDEKSNKNGKIKHLFGKFGNKLGLRATKKKQNEHRSLAKSKNHSANKPTVIDVYNFEEETSENNSSFKNETFPMLKNTQEMTVTNLDPKSKINQIKSAEEKNNDEKFNHESGISSLKWNVESDSDTDRYYDSMSFEEMSLSSESTPEFVPDNNKAKQTQKKNNFDKSKDNQKKCMIMGRIFKNASKPKLEDKIPEIRDLSSEENSKLVENYLDSCSSIDNGEHNIPNEELPNVPSNNITIVNSANKMSKKEMDMLFDKLVEEEKKVTESQTELVEEKDTKLEENLVVPNHKSQIEKKKPKEPKIKSGKNKKRQRHNSADSLSSDEFTLTRHSKSSKKHHKTPRKSTKPKKDSGINLEQEIKECIGVAGRKSQRKCTSGKQNVLVEFWSSDESMFEEESATETNENENINIDELKMIVKACENSADQNEVLLNNDNSSNLDNIELPKLPATEKPKQNTLDIYDFDSDMESKIEMPLKMKIDDLPVKTDQNEFIGANKITIPRKIQKPRPSKGRKFSKSHDEEDEDTEYEGEKTRKKNEHKRKKNNQNEDAPDVESSIECLAVTRKKRNAGEQLYYWSSSSDDEFQDLIEVKPIREDTDDDRPMQHGWIVGDSPKKLVTMLAQAKGKKLDGETVKEQGKKNRTTL